MPGESSRHMSVLEVLLVLVAILFPVNYSLAFALRPVDLLLLVLVFLSLPFLRVRHRDIFTLSVLYFALYAASIAAGIITRGIVTPTNFAFVYKYLVAFLLFWVLGSVRLSPRALRVLRKALFAVFALLVFWVFAYVLLRVLGVFRGNFRVSFPFSNSEDLSLSDAPTYSVVLSTFLIAWLFWPRPRSTRNFIMLAATAGTTGLAIMLSGSRTGLVSTVLTLTVYCVRRIFRGILRGRLVVRRSSLWLGLALLLLVAFVGVRLSGISDTDVLQLLSRAVSFVGDESVNNRMTKAKDAFEQVMSGPVVLGIGSQSTFHTWFDGSWPNILLNTGPFGVITFALLLLLLLRRFAGRARARGTTDEYQALEYIFLNYLICSITTEAFLVTRGLVPFALCAGLFMQRIEGTVESSGPVAARLRESLVAPDTRALAGGIEK